MMIFDRAGARIRTRILIRPGDVRRATEECVKFKGDDDYEKVVEVLTTSGDTILLADPDRNVLEELAACMQLGTSNWGD